MRNAPVFLWMYSPSAATCAALHPCVFFGVSCYACNMPWMALTRKAVSVPMAAP